MSHSSVLLSVIGLLLLALVGCSSYDGAFVTAEGAKASAFCSAGGPGGVRGLGPGGVVTGAKVTQDFKGEVAVAADCLISISAE